MSKIISLGFIGVLAGIFLFSAPSAYAAEIPASQTNISISKEEVVILQQSLLALTMVLTDLQATLAKSKDLPPNTAQIIASLSNIGKSLVQISVTMEKRGLVVAPAAAFQAPLVVVQEVGKAAVESFDETVVSESNFSDSENQSENQFETLLGENNAKTESQKTLVASIGAIASQRITWIIVIVLAIGAVLLWKMKGGQEAAKA